MENSPCSPPVVPPAPLPASVPVQSRPQISDYKLGSVQVLSALRSQLPTEVWRVR